MTLEKLARITAAGFVGVDERLDAHDKKIEVMGQRLDTLKGEIKTEVKDEITGAVDKLLTKADSISKKLDTLLQENKIGTGLFHRHDARIDGHEKRIERLEEITKKI